LKEKKMKKFILPLVLLLTTPADSWAKKENPMVNQVSRTRFEVSRTALEKNVKDPVAQLSTFRALPSFATGFFSGLKLSSFSNDCLLPRFGIKDGDVVEMVNGQPVRGPADVMEIGQKLANARPGAKIRVNLRRGDRDLIHTYLLVE